MSQAFEFCTWIGGRLPSEAEWEYAARNGGQEIKYPWGDDLATCEYAAKDSNADGGKGCGEGRTWPVCSKTAGNTVHGICDMAGNVYEWVQDWWHASYDCDANPHAGGCAGGGRAPIDGSAWETPVSEYRVVRGGSWFNDAQALEAAVRDGQSPEEQFSILGFRCAR